MTVSEIRELTASQLPSRYEHMNLTFYGRECRPKGEHVIIGDDYGAEFCVSLSDGAIHSIDPREELPTRFVNSGILELARFIEVSESFSDTPINDTAMLSRRMREALTQIDAKAFADPENWWAIVLEQMEYGLL
jgi:hypothetical protein